MQQFFEVQVKLKTHQNRLINEWKFFLDQNHIIFFKWM